MKPLPPSARGPAWMLVACVAFAVMWMVIRVASRSVHPFEIVFFRNAFGLAALGPMLLRRPGLLAPERALPNLRRASSGLIATLATFYAVANAPLATALAINYTAPLFATVGAVLFLGERIAVRRGAALAVGFAGMLVVVRPGALPMTPGVGAALLSAVATAFSYLAIRALVGRDDPRSVAAWSFVLMLPPSAVVALFVWSWPSAAALGLLAVIGGLAAVGQIGLAYAFASAPASAVLPYDFVRFGLITLGGIVLFGERYDVWTIGGGAIILAATIYLAVREAAVARARKTALAPES
ncbi:MAG: DMT family transporter [Sphingomonadaceae bacterium]|nr:DMT family transporter [Sphingomonadaceae bacterium]